MLTTKTGFGILFWTIWYEDTLKLQTEQLLLPILPQRIMWWFYRQPEVIIMMLHSLWTIWMMSSRIQTRILMKGLRHLLTNTGITLKLTRSFKNWQWTIVHWNGGEIELTSYQPCPNWHECTCLLKQQLLLPNVF